MTTIYVAIAVIGLIVALAWVAMKWGKAKARADHFEESHDIAVEAKKIDEAVARASDDSLHRELRGDQ